MNFVWVLVCCRLPQKLKFGRNVVGTTSNQRKERVVLKLGLILGQQSTLTKNNFTTEPISIFVPDWFGCFVLGGWGNLI